MGWPTVRDITDAHINYDQTGLREGDEELTRLRESYRDYRGIASALTKKLISPTRRSLIDL